MTISTQAIQLTTERSTTICTNCGGGGWVLCEFGDGENIVCRCWLCNSNEHDVCYAFKTVQTPGNDGRYVIMLVKQ